MKDINPKTKIGTNLLSRFAPTHSWPSQPMTAVLVDFSKGAEAFGSRRARPYIYATPHVCGQYCTADCPCEPYRTSARRSRINQQWRIADFSQVGFEGFGFEVTELAYKAAWSIVRACAGFNMVTRYVGGNPYHCNDAAMNWTKGPIATE